MRSGTFKCYAVVLQRVRDVSPDELSDSLTLCLLLLTTISHTGRTVTNRGGDGAVAARSPSRSADEPALYREWIDALSASGILEHAAAAMYHLQKCAKTALQAGLPGLESIRSRLVDACGHLRHAILCTVEPQLKQPILSLCPRPLAAPNADADPTIRAALPAVRALLSGTCVQYWLGRELLESRLWFTEGEGPTHGLPADELRAALAWVRGRPGDAGAWRAGVSDLVQHLDLCTSVWQVTVSGPVPPARHPMLGRPGAPRRGGGGGAGPLALPPGMPYAAADVYDMGAESMAALVRRAPELAAQGLLSFAELSNLARLLVRLVSELAPPPPGGGGGGGAAGRRLPGLWRSLASLLGSMGCAGAAGHGGVPAGWRPELFNGVIKTISSLLLMGVDVDVEPAQEQRLGDGGGFAGGAAAPRPASPAPSLRCALDGGFLPGLEQQLRRAASQALYAAPFLLTLVNALLRVPGAWPAVLAHGSAREAASLIVTLRKAAAELERRGGGLAAAGIRPDVPGVSMAAVDPRTAASSQLLAYLTGLLEQTQVVVVTGLDAFATGASTGSSAAAGGGKAGKANLRRRKGTKSAAAAAAASPLPLNDALEVNAPARTPLRWLADMGGFVTRGSAAARQQATLAVFALAQWLPAAARVWPSGWWWSGEMVSAVAAAVLSAALQCLAARVRMGREGEGEANAETGAAGCGSRNGGAGAAAAAAPEHAAEAEQAFASWRTFLLEDLDVFAWLDRALHGVAGSTSSSAVASAPCLADEVPCPRTYPGVVPRALDVLEVLAGALPEDVGRRVAVAVAVAGVARSGSGGGGGGGRGAGAGSTKSLTIKEALLRRHDREGLVEGLKSLREAHDADGAGAAGPSDSLAAYTALRRQAAQRFGLARLPVLPSPADAAAAAVGVRPCGRPGCNNLEGPAESALAPKRCSRCKAVWYCGAACQAAHWKAGHKAECAPAQPQ